MTAMTIIADTIREECFPRDGADGLGEYCDETAVKIIDALHLAGYGVLDPREIMLNAANAVELRKLRDQQLAIREFLGLTYRISPEAYDEPMAADTEYEDLGYSGLDRSFDDHAGWQGGGL